MENSAVTRADSQLRWSRAYLRRVRRGRVFRRAALLVLVAFTLGLCVYAAATSGLVPVFGPAPSSDPPPPVSDLPPAADSAPGQEPAPATCRVLFDARGGTMTLTEEIVPRGGFAGEPEAPVREAYAFAGWFADEARTVRWNFGENPVLEDLTLYARWEQLPAEAEALPQTGRAGTSFWRAVLAASLLLAALCAACLAAESKRTRGRRVV